jgi:hypothetical protein
MVKKTQQKKQKGDVVKRFWYILNNLQFIIQVLKLNNDTYSLVIYIFIICVPF